MDIFNIIQIVSAIILIVLVLLQRRGVGLGAAFGGEGNVYRTKRGLEKNIFYATIIISIIFLASSLAQLIF